MPHKSKEPNKKTIPQRRSYPNSKSNETNKKPVNRPQPFFQNSSVFLEMPFDPLEDPANSSSEEHSDKSSNADSVSDEDSDWWDRAKQARIGKITLPSIDVITHPLPAKIPKKQ
jgi:hypothetical protein